MEIERVEERRRLQRKYLEHMRVQKSDEIVEAKGFKGFSNVFGSANDS